MNTTQPKDAVRLLETIARANGGAIPEIDWRLARTRWAIRRTLAGYRSYQPLLSPPEAVAKLAKALGFTVARRDYALCLAQAGTSGIYQMCRYRTATCSGPGACVAETGRGGAPCGASGHSVQDARALKTRFAIEDPSAFWSLLAHELENHVKRHGLIACRLSAFSDIPWERYLAWFFARFAGVVQFYDYTKWAPAKRVSCAAYQLTYSASETWSVADVVRVVRAGHNVAVVFDTPYHPGADHQEPLPATWCGLPVVDGDVHDSRYLDPRGVVVGLRRKGKTLQRLSVDPTGHGFVTPAQMAQVALAA